MLFRQLFDSTSSTYTYLLADEATREAVIVDPVFEQARRDTALIRELDLRLLYSADTHVHADHVTSAWLLRKQLQSRIVLSKAGGAQNVDVAVDHGDVLEVGSLRLEVRATPGHTSGCTTYVLHEQKMAFTGDALLIRGAGRTDFQQGDAATLFRSVHEQILSLADDFLLYPAHDYAGRTCTSVGEEKRHNPRLGGERDEADFVGYMNNLGLAHPKQIDAALPANLRCGEPDDPSAIPEEPDWAPLTLTYAGIYELGPNWLEEHLDEVHLVDVREAREFDGELGHIEGARRIPLSQLAERAAELEGDKPVVTVCRSGGRSAQAAVLLKKAGIERVANLAGGMLAWRALKGGLQQAWTSSAPLPQTTR